MDVTNRNIHPSFVMVRCGKHIAEITSRANMLAICFMRKISIILIAVHLFISTSNVVVDSPSDMVTLFKFTCTIFVLFLVYIYCTSIYVYCQHKRTKYLAFDLEICITYLLDLFFSSIMSCAADSKAAALASPTSINPAMQPIVSPAAPLR
jgi:hypothetical protein